MSRKTYPTMILFGVKGHKKCLVGYHNKMLGGISVAICEYAGAEEDDAKIDLADIEGQWSTLHFCNKEREEEPPDSEEIKTEGECEDEPVEAVPRQWI